MKKNKGIYFFILITFCLTLVSCIQAEDKKESLDFGAAADFKLEDIRQNTYTLSSYKDKQPVIIFFWTTWCPYCRKALKTLNAKYPQLLKEGIELLAINVQEPAYKAQNLASKEGLFLKVLLDKYAEVAEAYDIMGVPTYILINKKGNIVFRDNYFPDAEYKALLSDNGG